MFSIFAKRVIGIVISFSYTKIVVFNFKLTENSGQPLKTELKWKFNPTWPKRGV